MNDIVDIDISLKFFLHLFIQNVMKYFPDIWTDRGELKRTLQTENKTRSQ